jgi:replicative DNA helicase
MSKAVPYDSDVEEAVLGAILVDNKNLVRVLTKVNQDDFYVPANAELLRSFCRIGQDSVIDLASVRQDLGDDFERHAGDERLARLESIYSGNEALSGHLEVLLEYSVRRQLMRIFADSQELCRSGEISSQEVISNVSTKILALNKTREPIQHVNELLKKFTELCEEAADKPEGCNLEIAVPTGIGAIDSELTAGGIPRGLVCSIGAESSKGKSALGATICKNAGQLGQRVLVCSLEDSAMSVAIRYVSQESGIENKMLQRLRPPGKSWPRMTDGINKVWNSPIYFLPPYGSIDEICSTILAESIANPFDLLLLDYLQLMDPGENMRGGGQRERVDHCFSAINNMARRMPSTATVLISQLARIHGARPTIANMYHSGQIEQGSRTIMLIWAPKELSEIGARVVDIAKQHNGPTCEVVTGWSAENVLFYQLPMDKNAEAAEALDRAIRAEGRK